MQNKCVELQKRPLWVSKHISPNCCHLGKSINVIYREGAPPPFHQGAQPAASAAVGRLVAASSTLISHSNADLGGRKVSGWLPSSPATSVEPKSASLAGDAGHRFRSESPIRYFWSLPLGLPEAPRSATLRGGFRCRQGRQHIKNWWEAPGACPQQRAA
jgi:hypothetical protein